MEKYIECIIDEENVKKLKNEVGATLYGEDGEALKIIREKCPEIDFDGIIDRAVELTIMELGIRSVMGIKE
jgi:hypothetical protein